MNNALPSEFYSFINNFIHASRTMEQLYLLYMQKFGEIKKNSFEFVLRLQLTACPHCENGGWVNAILYLNISVFIFVLD